MKKISCYTETVKVNGEDWTVMLVPTGKGLKTVYFAYLFDACGHAKETIGFPIDQRKAKIDPHVYEPEEIMDMALYSVDDYISDLYRVTQFENILFDFLDEVDSNREEAKRIYEMSKSAPNTKGVQ